MTGMIHGSFLNRHLAGGVPLRNPSCRLSMAYYVSVVLICYAIVYPPSTTTLAPLSSVAASLDRNAAHAAISFG